MRANAAVPLQRSRPVLRQVRRVGRSDVLQFLKHEGHEDDEVHEGRMLNSSV
jgi:hypothetical protein